VFVIICSFFSFSSFLRRELLKNQARDKHTQSYDPTHKQKVCKRAPWQVACRNVIIIHPPPPLPPLPLILMRPKMRFPIKMRYIVIISMTKGRLTRPHPPFRRCLSSRRSVRLGSFSFCGMLTPSPVLVEAWGRTAELRLPSTQARRGTASHRPGRMVGSLRSGMVVGAMVGV
jgi:hypothetical protein